MMWGMRIDVGGYIKVWGGKTGVVLLLVVVVFPNVAVILIMWLFECEIVWVGMGLTWVKIGVVSETICVWVGLYPGGIERWKIYLQKMQLFK